MRKLGNPACCCAACNPRRICSGAWSLADACEERGDADCARLHGALEGVAVSVARVWYDNPATRVGPHEVPYAAGHTDEHGKWCVDIPDSIADPTEAPTVDPVGGGASGGTLPRGTYRFTYAHANRWGTTAPAPLSPEVQVGIPDPTAYPLLAVPDPTSTALSAGGSLQVGTWVARHVFRDAGGLHNAPSATSAPFAVFTPGDVPRLALPPLSRRPNAASVDIYLAIYDEDDEDGGTFRLYRSGVTSTTADLDAAFAPAAAPPVNSNTSAKNLPRVGFADDPAALDTKVYARSIGPAGSFAACLSLSAFDSPADFTGTLGGACPGAENATWKGDYRVVVHPDECNAQSAVRTIDGVLCPPPFLPGFCCFAHDIDAVDFDTGEPVAATWECTNPDACTDEEAARIVPAVHGLGGGTPGTPSFNRGHSEFVGPCLPDPLPCPPPTTPPPDDPCEMATVGTGVDPTAIGAAGSPGDSPPVTICTASAEGYHASEPICVPAPCGVPGVRTEAPGPVKLYSAANWVHLPVCCPDPPCVVPPVRRRSMFPKVVHAFTSAPEPITGGVQGWTLPYIGPRAGAGPFVEHVWGTGCIGGTGGYGAVPSCLPMNPPFGDLADLRGWCDRKYGTPPDCPAYPGPNPGRLFPQRFKRDERRFYGSTRISWVVRVWSPLGSAPFCEASFLWENFWDGACQVPGSSQGPLVAGADGYCPPQYAVGSWLGEEQECECGRDDINDDWLAGTLFDTHGFASSGPWAPEDCVPLEWASTAGGAAVVVTE